MTMVAGLGRPVLASVDGSKAAGAADDRTGAEGGAPKVAGIDARILGGVAIGGCIAAVAGVAIARRPIQSKVIDVIDGVQILSNPRMPRGIDASWGVPQRGSVFGVAPKPAVSIEHVDQGALADCWNQAGQGAIAYRRPEVFEQGVQTLDDYVVFDLPGRGRVGVTKELPLDRDGNPAFGGSGADDAVYWPAYVEKIQAAVARNGYRSLEGGFTKDAFRQLLGTEPARVQSRGTLYDDVLAYREAKVPLAISTHAEGTLGADDLARMEQLNIKANHYYVPLDPDEAGNVRLVDLFNPWGDQHPTGPVAADDLNRFFDGVDTPDEYIRFGNRGF